MNLKHPGSHRLMMCIAGLALLLVLPICSCRTNGSTSTPSGTTVTASPDPTIPTCNPICADALGQPGIVFVGQVKQMTEATSSPTTSSGAVSVRGTMYTLLVSLPQGSSPGTKDQLTLIANTQLTLKIGDFIKVVATPNNDTNHTFTVQQPIKMVTQQDFQNQLIEYQGVATMSVSCPASNCAGQAISFGLGGLTFNFGLSSPTNVQGFGTPPSIMSKQTVDVIVRFVQGASPSVLQVTNPTPSSETPTTSPTPITTLT